MCDAQLATPSIKISAEREILGVECRNEEEEKGDHDWRKFR